MQEASLSRVTVFGTPISRNHVSSGLQLTCAEFMSKTRVLLADDHIPILEEMHETLGDEFEIVGVVHNGRDALTEVRQLDPDVVVIDISMPILNGIEAVTEMHATNPRTKVVFLTVHQDQDFVDAAFSAGACGYVIKEDVTTDLVPAIREALLGHIYISPSLLRS
jgi:DNA-binding NarL/FixJ family response regulator